MTRKKCERVVMKQRISDVARCDVGVAESASSDRERKMPRSRVEAEENQTNGVAFSVY